MLKSPSTNERVLMGGSARASVYLGSNSKSGFSSAIALSRQTREAEQERERYGGGGGEGGGTPVQSRAAYGTFQFASAHGLADTKLWMQAVLQHLSTIKLEVCGMTWEIGVLFCFLFFFIVLLLLLFFVLMN
jgi:hypothetical protein